MPNTIVIIDDDQDDIDILKEAIIGVDKSAVCISFTDPVEAVNAIQSDLILKPDIIFIDINMPKLNGDECLKEIRKNADLVDATIAMLSTSMPEEVAKTLRMAGANFTFRKPSKINEYYNILENILVNKEVRISS